MAITDKKISEIYSGRDIASLSDRPNEDGVQASDLKARFDQLGKEVIPNFNDLIDELNGILTGDASDIDALEGRMDNAEIDIDEIETNRMLLTGSNSNIDVLTFFTETIVPFTKAGQLRWNEILRTLELKISDDVTLQIGKEILLEARNDEATSISNGQAVYVSGGAGTNVYIKRASTANGDIAQATIGVATEGMQVGEWGHSCTEGLVNGINTNAWEEGDKLYLGVDGALTNVEPTSPTPKVFMGVVLRKHSTLGSIYVKVRAIPTMAKLSDVFVSSIADGHALIYNGTTGRFENEAIYNKAEVDALANARYTKTEMQTNGSSLVNGNNVSNTPSGNISATTVQGAIVQINTQLNEKVSFGETITVLVPNSSYGAIPDLDTLNETLTFYTDTILFWKKGYYRLNSSIVVDIKIATSARKLFFNITTNTFVIRAWNEAHSNKNELLVAAIRFDASRKIISMSCPYSVNGFNVSDSASMDKNVVVLLSGSNYPILDNTNQRLVFEGGTHPFEIAVSGVLYTNAVPATGMSLDLSVINGTSAWFIIFKLSDKTWNLIPYTSLASVKNTHIIFGSIRKHSSTGKYHLNLPCPFIENGKLYGIADMDNVVENPKDANVMAIAHRGYSDIAPENTLPAYKLAKDKGYYYVECDVRFTSDGIPVILHDETIDRTSDGTGTLSSLTLAELETYDFGSWKSSNYVGTQILTFEDFILCCKKLNLHPYIEFKITLTTEQAELLYSIVKKHGMIKNSSWFGFNYDNLTKMKTIDPNIRLGWSRSAYETTTLNDLMALKTSTNKVFLLLYYNQLTPAISQELYENDINVEVWTVNSSADMITAVNSGANGIFTDKLNVAELLQNE